MSLSKDSNFWLKDMLPALLVLFFTTILSVSMVDFTFTRGWEAIYKMFFRFFRLTFFLCLPLYGLAPFYRFFLNKFRRILLQTEKMERPRICPMKHWITRPLQGIGIGLIFSMKLLTVLQVIAGPRPEASSFLPKGRFQLDQFFIITGITAFISFFLSILWTLDDIGIRYFNKRDQELKMIGKYAGTIMPVIFGLYGIFGLFSQYPTSEASLYLFKIVIVLYPPFAIFAVIHLYFLNKYSDKFITKSPVIKGGIWLGHK